MGKTYILVINTFRHMQNLTTTGHVHLKEKKLLRHGETGSTSRTMGKLSGTVVRLTVSCTTSRVFTDQKAWMPIMDDKSHSSRKVLRKLGTRKPNLRRQEGWPPWWREVVETKPRCPDERCSLIEDLLNRYSSSMFFFCVMCLYIWNTCSRLWCLCPQLCSATFLPQLRTPPCICAGTRRELKSKTTRFSTVSSELWMLMQTDTKAMRILDRLHPVTSTRERRIDANQRRKARNPESQRKEDIRQPLRQSQTHTQKVKAVHHQAMKRTDINYFCKLPDIMSAMGS